MDRLFALTSQGLVVLMRKASRTDSPLIAQSIRQESDAKLQMLLLASLALGFESEIIKSLGFLRHGNINGNRVADLK
jgi:hypothetical protein